MKGIIYYTDNELDKKIESVCRDVLSYSGLPVTSSSLRSIDFGNNEVIHAKRGYTAMVMQILSCLSRGAEKYVFFCEHDVLYHPSHFEFTPERDDVFYYNTNNLRWDYPTNRLIRYDGLTSLSQMCVNREFALEHYKRRLKAINDLPTSEFASKEPKRGRVWGYEPGRKTTTSGGFSDDKSSTWEADYPNIDIRHKGTYSPPKVTLNSFKHPPTGWTEVSIDSVPGWDLRGLFDIWN